jgi:hypothetical protein
MAIDNTGTRVAGRINGNASGTTIDLYPTVGGAASGWTAGGTKTVTGQFFYESA